MSSEKPIRIDLRTDLAKIPDDIEASPKDVVCRYTQPCVVGQLMTPEDRQRLKDNECDHRSIGYLTQLKDLGTPPIKVETPDREQAVELVELQNAFDNSNTAELRSLVKNLKEKYRGAPSSSSSDLGDQ